MHFLKILPYFLLSATSILTICPLRSQNTLTVRYTQKTSLRGDNSLSGPTALYISGGESVYVHESAPDENYIEDNGGMEITLIPGDPSGFPIYKNTHIDSLIYASSIGFYKDYCVIRDTLPRIEWSLDEDGESRKFGSYTGLLAYGWFGDRLYEAWFTPDLPYSHGPHKLNGLPGVILEANSVDGYVNFYFDEINVGDIGNQITKPSARIQFNGRKEYEEDLLNRNKRLQKKWKSEGSTMQVRTPYADSQIERVPGGYDPDADPDDEIPPNN